MMHNFLYIFLIVHYITWPCAGDTAHTSKTTSNIIIWLLISTIQFNFCFLRKLTYNRSSFSNALFKFCRILSHNSPTFSSTVRLPLLVSPPPIGPIIIIATKMLNQVPKQLLPTNYNFKLFLTLLIHFYYCSSLKKTPVSPLKVSKIAYSTTHYSATLIIILIVNF